MNETIRHTPVPANEMKPPSYGGPQRDAINSVVDNIVGDLCGKIAGMRHILDDIEQQVLESAAGAKHALHDHVATCVKVNDELQRTQAVIDNIKTATKAI